jgi:cytochrome c556
MAPRTIMRALALTLGLGLAAAGTALAADPSPPATTPGGKALLARQAHFKDQAATFKAIGDETRKDAPDKAAIAAGAAKLKALAADLPTWFPKGSGPETGLPTAAKPEIWTDADGFATAAAKFQDESARLAAVSTGGDMDAIKAQFRATAGACKTCHDMYRAPDQH